MAPSDFDVEFGERVRSARLDARLTQEDLAQRVGLSRTSVVNIEHGRQGVYLRFLIPLANALECSAVSLLPLDIEQDRVRRPSPYDDDALGFLEVIQNKMATDEG